MRVLVLSQGVDQDRVPGGSDQIGLHRQDRPPAVRVDGPGSELRRQLRQITGQRAGEHLARQAERDLHLHHPLNGKIANPEGRRGQVHRHLPFSFTSISRSAVFNTLP
jgi:hypothetical protein